MKDQFQMLLRFLTFSSILLFFSCSPATNASSPAPAPSSPLACTVAEVNYDLDHPLICPELSKEDALFFFPKNVKGIHKKEICLFRQQKDFYPIKNLRSANLWELNAAQLIQEAQSQCVVGEGYNRDMVMTISALDGKIYKGDRCYTHNKIYATVRE